MKLKLVGAALVTAALAGCGTNQNDRVGGGAAAGAATGAAVGLVGGPVGVAAGAAIGAGAGAATGAATTPKQVNLGTPPWDDSRPRENRAHAVRARYYATHPRHVTPASHHVTRPAPTPSSATPASTAPASTAPANPPPASTAPATATPAPATPSPAPAPSTGTTAPR